MGKWIEIHNSKCTTQKTVYHPFRWRRRKVIHWKMRNQMKIEQNKTKKHLIFVVFGLLRRPTPHAHRTHTHVHSSPHWKIEIIRNNEASSAFIPLSFVIHYYCLFAYEWCVHNISHNSFFHSKPFSLQPKQNRSNRYRSTHRTHSFIVRYCRSVRARAADVVVVVVVVVVGCSRWRENYTWFVMCVCLSFVLHLLLFSWDWMPARRCPFDAILRT